ncbi:MAG: hypothetical protein CVU38_03145 [Chloroflexi bacterium HGW-Chloroflexi-1]|nr:MAG: hypothetical protein CVU38_03145 [Chloroflexi bacterium HGW-Chloroflexi-1]
MGKNRTIWILLLVVFPVLCLCCAATAAFFMVRSMDWGGSWILGGRVAVTGQFNRALVVDGPVSLSVDVPVGDVTVEAGTSGQVTVTATKRAWGSTRNRAQEVLDGIDIGVDQTGNQVRVKVTGLSDVRNVSRSPQVDLVISVPSETASTLDVNVGRVLAAGLSGDLSVKVDVGEVTLNQVLPQELLEIKTRVANVEFTGALVPGAAYRLSSDVGRISMRVPADSAFSIDARSDIGNVDPGFVLSGRSAREGFLSKEVRGSVGENASASLYLRSRVGEISVRPER